MRLYSIQYLRCIAVVLTIGIHLLEQLRRLGYEGNFSHYLPSGVDLFFVISGYIMWVTTYRRGTGPLEFFWRRFARIVPLYWLVMGFMVAVMLVAPSALQSARFDLYHVITSFLFIPSLNAATGLMEPVLVPGWTLNYEMFFYLIFGITLLLPPRPRLIVMVAILVGLVCIQLFGVEELSVLGFYTSSVMLEFAAGLLVGAVYIRGWSLPPRLAKGLVVVGVVALIGLTPLRDELPRSVVWGIPGFVIMVALLSVEMRGRLQIHPLLSKLGDASYSIYLAHGLMLSAWAQGWRLLGLGNSSLSLILFAFSAVVVSLIFGLAVYYWVERPLIQLLRPRRAPVPSEAAPPGSEAPAPR